MHGLDGGAGSELLFIRPGKQTRHRPGSRRCNEGESPECDDAGVMGQEDADRVVTALKDHRLPLWVVSRDGFACGLGQSPFSWGRASVAGEAASAFLIPALARHILQTVCAPEESLKTSDGNRSASRPHRGQRILMSCFGRVVAQVKQSPDRSAGAGFGRDRRLFPHRAQTISTTLPAPYFSGGNHSSRVRSFRYIARTT
jgi:hypothetical protein